MRYPQGPSAFQRRALNGLPQDDAVSREFTLFSRQGGFSQDDAVSREFTLFSRQSGFSQDDAVSREFTLFSRQSGFSQDDAVSREFTLFSRQSGFSQDDAVSREFTLFSRQSGFSQDDAVSREFTVRATQFDGNPTDTISREFTLSNPFPNLVLEAAAVPSSVAADAPFRVSWSVLNDGPSPAYGVWRDRVYLSRDDQLGDDLDLGGFPFQGSLAPGERLERAHDVTIPRSQIPEPGTYWLIFYADADRQIFEQPEGDEDNWKAIPVFVTLTPLPDLRVEEIEAPAEARFGQAITVRARVRNHGEGPTNASDWKDRIQLLRDGQPPVASSDASNPAFLDAGEEYWTEFTLPVPKGIFGSWSLRVVADHHFQVDESDETNNSLEVPITILVPDLPDLEASDVRAPEFATAGQPLPAPVEWRVRNIGSARTPPGEIPWVDRVYLSEDQVLDGSDRQIAEVVRTDLLDPGQEYNGVSSGPTIPADLAPGDYFVIVKADATDKVYEFTSEPNNVAVRARTISVSGKTADLEPTIVAAPSEAESGDLVTVTYRVKNNGPDEARPSWSDRVYLSDDNQLDDGDLALHTHVRTTELPRDESYEVSVQVKMPDCLRETRFLFVQTDAGNTVFESTFETNNTAGPHAIQLNQNAPNLEILTLSYPSQASAGSSFRVAWTVKNSGEGPTKQTGWTDRVVLSRDTQLGGGDDLVLGTFARSGGLAQGSAYVRDEEVQLPANASGRYRVIVQTDAVDVVPECGLEEDNVKAGGELEVVVVAPDLQVTSMLAPASVLMGDQATIEWTVRNSGDAPTLASIWVDRVYLSSDPTLDGSDLLLGSVMRMGSLAIGASYESQLTATVPLVPPGNYHLLVATDATNAVFEGQSEDNNQSQRPITVGFANVDLEVTSISAPTEGLSGQPLNLSFTVKNGGEDATIQSLWLDQVVLSRDRIVDALDRRIGFALRTARLQAGESYSATIEVSIPAGLTGEWFIIPVTDWNNQVPEVDEFDNDDASHLITLALPPPVDLTLDSISEPSVAFVGEPMEVTYAVRNVGQNAAQGRWVDSVYLSADDKWDVDDPLLERVEVSADVVAGSSYSRTITARTPILAPGSYRVLVITNARRTLRELDYANNASVSTSFAQVDYQVLPLDVEVPVAFSPGHDRFYKTPVLKGLTVRLNSQASDSSASLDIFGAMNRPARRSSFDIRNPEIAGNPVRATIGDTAEGWLFSLFGGLFGAETAGLLLAENVPFSVEAVSPQEVGDVGEVTLTLTGGRLGELLEARLASEGASLPSADIEILPDGRARVRFSVDKQKHGLYSLEIRSESGWLPTGQTVRVTSFQGRTPVQELVDEPQFRLGVEVQQRGVVRNDSNVDVTNVMVLCWVDLPSLVILNDRPARTFPIKSGEIWNTAPPSNVHLPNETVDVFVVKRLAPGEEIPFNFRLSSASVREQFRGQPINIRVSTRAFPGESAGTYFRALLEGFRQEYIESGEPAVGEFAELLADEERWFGKMAEGLQFLGIDVGDSQLRRLGPGATGSGKKACELVCLGKWAFCKAAIIGLPCLAAAKTAGVLSPLCALSIIIGNAKCGAELVCCLFDCKEQDPDPCSTRNVVCSLSSQSVQIIIGGFVFDVALPFPSFSVIETAVQCLPPPVDPNEKVGIVGFGEAGFVGLERNKYRVHFENLASAGAWAQRVMVWDQIEFPLDIRSVVLDEVVVGGQSLTRGGAAGQSVTGRYELMTPSGMIFCDVSAAIDVASGRIAWILQAIDPLTGEPPVSATQGLLPPEDGNGIGQGYVSYRIRANGGARTGEILRNSATIVFDQEAPITTNAWINTLDAGKPTSRVSAIAPPNGASFRVFWQGQDDVGGSGIASYDVYVSRNSGPYELWLDRTTEQSAVFNGLSGSQYRFYSRARDQVGNVEDAPDQADAAVSTGSRFDPATPVISTFTPGTVAAGGPSFKLRIRGAGFEGDVRCFWNGEERPVQWVSRREVIVDVSSDLIANPGQASIVLVNPAKNGLADRESEPKLFQIGRSRK